MSRESREVQSREQTERPKQWSIVTGKQIGRAHV